MAGEQQWWKQFTNITGATSTTYSFTATAAQTGYEYQAVFTNSQGTATTTAATLTVLTTPPMVTTSPANQSIARRCDRDVHAAASGNPTPTVQWQVSANAWNDVQRHHRRDLDDLQLHHQCRRKRLPIPGGLQQRAGSATTSAATLTVREPSGGDQHLRRARALPPATP